MLITVFLSYHLKLTSGDDENTTGTDINNIFIKLKFQKTVIPSSHLFTSDNEIYNNTYANSSSNM